MHGTLNPFAEKQKRGREGIQQFDSTTIDYWVLWLWTRSAAVEAIQVAVLAAILPCIYIVAGPGLSELLLQSGWLENTYPISGHIIITVEKGTNCAAVYVQPNNTTSLYSYYSYHYHHHNT